MARRLTSRGWLALLGFAAAAAVTIVILTGVTGARSNESTADSAIGLLRHSPDGLGSFKQGTLASPGWVQRSGIDPDQARKADTSGSQWNVWLAASGDKACLFVAAPKDLAAGGTCGNASDLAAGHFGLTRMGGGNNPSVHVVGVVPDGVESVQLSDSRGISNVRVRDNVFVGETDASATAYSFTGPNGPQTEHVVIEK